MRTTLLELLPQLRRFARSLAGNPHDGDDLMQATAARILEKGLPDGVAPRAWVFTICKNLFVDGRRAHAVRERAVEQPELQEPPGAHGEKLALNEITIAEVERAMDGLPNDQRIVLSLVAIEGMSYREAAEVIDAPIGTVMSRLARARAALAVRFGDAAAMEEQGND